MNERTYNPKEIKDFFNSYQDLRNAVLNFTLEYDFKNSKTVFRKGEISQKPLMDLAHAIKKYEHCSCSDLRNEFINDLSLEGFKEDIVEVRNAFELNHKESNQVDSE